MSNLEVNNTLEIAPNAITHIIPFFRAHFGNQPAVIVADSNTMRAAGNAVISNFQSAGHLLQEPIVIKDPNLYAEYSHVAAVEAELRKHSAIPIAVGSGTINDLTKLASHNIGRRYLCVATAASMDGYTAFGASITRAGSKQTYACPAPAAVLADLNIIATAPAEMNAWGYADLLAKVTSGADWILADALDVEAIHLGAWKLVQSELREAIQNPSGIRARDPAALARLMHGLMQSGYAMQVSESSRPASGAEHQFSHLWDMQHHAFAGHAPSHGLKVGIGTLAITALYECLIRQPLELLDPEHLSASWPTDEEWIHAARIEFSDRHLTDMAIQELHAKYVTADVLKVRLHRLRSNWPQIQERLHAQLIPFTKLKTMLKEAGAATEPEQIGISRERLRKTYRQAYFIRRRFTILDLATETNLLETCLSEIFGEDGVWNQTAR